MRCHRYLLLRNSQSRVHANNHMSIRVRTAMRCYVICWQRGRIELTVCVSGLCAVDYLVRHADQQLGSCWDCHAK